MKGQDLGPQRVERGGVDAPAGVRMAGELVEVVAELGGLARPAANLDPQAVALPAPGRERRG